MHNDQTKCSKMHEMKYIKKQIQLEMCSREGLFLFSMNTLKLKIVCQFNIKNG